jgi:galactokinase
MQTPAELAALHFASYNVPGQIFSAPGRVNLIGEHTDYCDGFVMPAAIDFSTLIAISPRTDGHLAAHSVNFNQRIDYSLDPYLEHRYSERQPDSTARRDGTLATHWSDYPAGVIWALREANVPVENGFSLTIVGDVPLGAGLSSSASVEVATAFAVLGTTGLDMPLSKIAVLCRRAENAFVGANVGIMDQFVICCGKQDNAVMIDCRSLDFQLAPIPPDVRIVICNSMVKHSVAGGEYNTRRAEIEEGTNILRAHRPEIRALRDATVQDLALWGHEMKPNVLRRCRHVITEDDRVLVAVEAFRASDLTRFGELMHQAHVSFRDDFEASCAEIDILVDLADKQPGCFGARLTGGGFGGCTVNLVAATHAATFVEAMRAGYLKATGITAEIYTSRASAGAHAITL